ncbi:OmpA family protein [Pontibacter qinzhouensis]|uniref:OmpA family protein n=1 Tax=Pontibacter qinzhouensis TaxID=2603253 RepID=A0A5C8JL81_9BACT|nr:OmpA family protein [Pontibacter qinzhouensis]TXK37796.1 OmpA family protein [Pontibacter qinzhouensis]
MNYKYTPLYIFIALTLCLATNAQAQLRKADRLYSNYEFALALEQYEQAIAKRTPDLQTAQRIADSYRLTRRSQEAETWYAKVVNMQGRHPQNLYNYAEALRSNGKHEEAKKHYMAWGEELPEMAPMAQQKIQACDKAAEWMSKLPVAEVKAVPELNAAAFSDFSPISFGQGIIFSSDRAAGNQTKTFGWTGRPYLKLFKAEKNAAGSYGAPTALTTEINSSYHNAAATAAEAGQELYFTRTHLIKNKAYGNPDPTSWVEKNQQVPEYVSRLEIFKAQKQGDSWTNVQPFAYNKIEEYSVGHPALSPDGNVLYFVSDMPGGQGATDIYYTVRQQDGSWGKPVNAGSTINTAGNESFPYVDKNGKLFFASDGHVGLGGLDIFAADGPHNAWTSVKNLGYPINSSKNDYGIMFDSVNVSGLLSSNRDAANGTDDIYQFNMLQEAVILAIRTLERKQNQQKRTVEAPLPQARVKVTQQQLTDSTVFVTDVNGKYFLESRKGNTYTFEGKKDGFLNQSVEIEVPVTARDTVEVTLLFDKSTAGIAIVLEKIYYDLDKWAIRPDAARELDKLVKVLKANPAIKIEMSSHTDSREGFAYNQLLSERRAQAAVDYLISKGIGKERLTAKGYGKTRLVNGCIDGVPCSEQEHQLNRRTEFKIK